MLGQDKPVSPELYPDPKWATGTQEFGSSLTAFQGAKAACLIRCGVAGIGISTTIQNMRISNTGLTATVPFKE